MSLEITFKNPDQLTISWHDLTCGHCCSEQLVKAVDISQNWEGETPQTTLTWMPLVVYWSSIWTALEEIALLQKAQVLVCNWIGSDFIEDNLSTYCQFHQKKTSFKPLFLKVIQNTLWLVYEYIYSCDDIQPLLEIDWWLWGQSCKMFFSSTRVKPLNQILPQ